MWRRLNSLDDRRLKCWRYNLPSGGSTANGTFTGDIRMTNAPGDLAYLPPEYRGLVELRVRDLCAIFRTSAKRSASAASRASCPRLSRIASPAAPAGRPLRSAPTWPSR